MAFKINGSKELIKMFKDLDKDFDVNRRSSYSYRIHLDIAKQIKKTIYTLPVHSFAPHQGRPVPRPIRFVPYQTGRLRASLKARAGAAAGQKGAFGITSDVPYAALIERGNPAKGVPPQPFVSDTIAQLEPRIMEAYRKRIQRTLDTRARKQAQAAGQPRGAGGRFVAR